METLLKQLAVMYIFIFLGWFFGKRRKDVGEKSSILSFLLVNLFLPCKLFLNFSENFTVSYFQNNRLTVIISLGILAALIGLGSLVSRLLSREPYERKVYNYSTSISNYAYFGYVLVEQTLGSAAMNDLMVFCIPFSLYCYTFGVAMLMNRGNSFKSLMNTVTVSIAAGIVWGLLSLPVPGVLVTAMESASSCVGPVSMVLVGLTLSSFPVKSLIPGKSVWAYCGIRLMAVPFAVWGMCKLLGLVMPLPGSVYPAAVLMACMPCGLNPVVFPRMIGQDCRLGAKLILLSCILSCVTIPFWLWFLI